MHLLTVSALTPTCAQTLIPVPNGRMLGNTWQDVELSNRSKSL